jgi:hypothetical protein
VAKLSVSWSSLVLARGFALAGGVVTLALLFVGGAGASATQCAGSLSRSPNLGRGDNTLQAVAGASACNVWAVGFYLNPKRTVSRTLIEHWNGKRWNVQPSLSPSRTESELHGVAATSARNAWAVGWDCGRTACRTLIEHWKGKTWKLQASPNPSHASQLRSVTAISATNAWVVGYYLRHGVSRTLIEHWNGRSWKVQPSPNLGSFDNDLAAVSASSSSNAWAVGRYFDGTSERTLIEHWNGKRWKVQLSPDAGSVTDANEPQGVAAISPSRAWVVGDVFKGKVFHSLVEHWNGKRWKVMSAAHRGSSYRLAGVAAAAFAGVWAVGTWNDGTPHTLVEHWNGRAWKIESSPNLSPYPNQLFGVAALSRADAWAVGFYTTKAGVRRTLIEHWNGTAWTG